AATPLREHPWRIFMLFTKHLIILTRLKNKLPPDIRYVLCRPSKRNTRSRTRGNNVRTLLSELLYNNVNKELHLQELYSSARASRNSQKCFEMFLYEAFLLKQSTCLSSL